MTCTVVYNTEQLSQSQPGQVLLSSSEFPLEVCRQPARDEKKQLPTQLYYSVSLEKGLKPCDAQVFPGYHQQPKQKNSQVPEPQPVVGESTGSGHPQNFEKEREDVGYYKNGISTAA